MATTFKAQIKTDEKKKDGKCNIKIRVIHNGDPRYISTKYTIEPKWFNNITGTVDQKFPNYKTISRALTSDLNQLEDIVFDKLKGKADSMSAATLVTYLKEAVKIGEDIFLFANEKILPILDAEKRINYAESIRSTLHGLKDYVGTDKLNFESINYRFLEDFERYLRTNGIKEYLGQNGEKIRKGSKTNSIAIHMRNIRKLFNDAIKSDIIDLGVYPFRKYKIKTEKTRKRNIQVEQIKAIRDLDLVDPTEMMARDTFMLIFYTLGINVVDLVNLKYDDIEDGRIIFKRSKTKKLYSILLQPEALELIDRYKGKEYVLCFKELYPDYTNFTKAVNTRLKIIAELCNIKEELTTYYARHSLATIMYNNKIPKDIVSLALGHGNNTVTDIYIDPDFSLVDEANRTVLDLLL